MPMEPCPPSDAAVWPLRIILLSAALGRPADNLHDPVRSARRVGPDAPRHVPDGDKPRERQVTYKQVMFERAMYWNSRGAGTDTIGGCSD